MLSRWGGKHADGGKTEELSQGRTEAWDRDEPEVKQSQRGLMKRGSGRRNTGAQGVEKVTDPGTRHSELRARLRDAEQAPHETSQQLNSVQQSIEWESQRRRILDPRAFYRRGEAEEMGNKGPHSKSASISGNKGAYSYQTSTSSRKMAGGQ